MALKKRSIDGYVSIFQGHFRSRCAKYGFSVNVVNGYESSLQGIKMILAGVDEVGRGPLAGAVVAAAVILQVPIEGLRDSKKLSPKKRQLLAEQIKSQALAFAFGRAEVEEIDSLNIHHATLLAMKRAIEALSIQPDKLLVDGLFIPHCGIAGEAIVAGDDTVPEISAASILAKVLRDTEMAEMDLIYPGYGFASHKGYGTKQHIEAIHSLGPCPIHRRSFAPISGILSARVEENATVL